MLKKLALVFCNAVAGGLAFSCDPAAVCERISPYMSMCGDYLPIEICTAISGFCAGL